MKYPWKRFWCPREGRINLSDGGFLYDPESKYASWVQSDVVPFEEISSRSCLALLGEPGIGKSTVMEELHAALVEDINSAGDELLYINLNEYGDETRLIQALFASSEFTAWRTGNHVLHLFLDSLDECRLQIPHVGRVIVSQLRQVQSRLKWLRLRIACRTFDWPRVLETHLPSFWPGDDFGAYELVPLRRKDVEAAAETEGLDPTEFAEALVKAEAIPLAIKPVTLRFLLSIFKKHSALPTTRTELYERGCTLLCEEQNPNRQDLRRVGGSGVLSATERLNIAYRIAAISMFCQKPTICVAPSGDPRSTEEVTVSELANHGRANAASTGSVSEDAIRETLGTGLFSSRGPDRMGFAHQTYAEFLAGRYLELKEVSSPKRLTLLQHHSDFGAQIAPQLYQTAAWVASHDKVVFDGIAADEPQVLLRCDEGVLSAVQRSQLVDQFLQALNEGRANDRDWDLHRSYAKLKHSGLAEQLHPWIADRSKDSVARNTAIDIAEACRVTELQALLADTALNSREEGHLRGNAAHALASVGDKDTRSRLRPLALGEAGEDPLDDLKGNALRALWPDAITADELFAHLTRPKRQNYFGACSCFAEYELSNHLDADSLPSALRWLKGHGAERELTWRFSRLADQIIILAWKDMDAPDVLSGLASVSIELMTHHHELVADTERRDENSPLFEDGGNRRKLTQAMVEHGMDDHVHFALLDAGSAVCLVRGDDLEWCIEQLHASISRRTEPMWAKLVWTLFRWTEPSSEQLDLILDARVASSALRKESESFFTPVQLESEEARQAREQYEKIQKRQQQKEPRLLEWLPIDRIQHWLTRFEAGEGDAWWILLREMTLEDTSESYRHLFDPDIAELPGWRNSDAKTRDRIIDGAVAYLAAKNTFNQAGLLDGKGDEKDIAAYKALVLLLKERPAELGSLSNEIWDYWAPVLLGPFGFDEGRVIQKSLISLAYSMIPERVLEVLQQKLQHQIDKGDEYLSVIDLVEDIWDRHMCAGMYALLEQAEVNPACWGRLLSVLFAHGEDRVAELAKGKLSLPIPSDGAERGIALQAALVLVRSTPDAGWGTIFPLLQDDPDFGCELVREVAFGLHHNFAE